MMEGPLSSYSYLEIHIRWKVEREARTTPPVQAEYLIFDRAVTAPIVIVGGARAVISLRTRGATPGNNMLPPERMMLAEIS